MHPLLTSRLGERKVPHQLREEGLEAQVLVGTVYPAAPALATEFAAYLDTTLPGSARDRSTLAPIAATYLAERFLERAVARGIRAGGIVAGGFLERAPGTEIPYGEMTCRFASDGRKIDLFEGATPRGSIHRLLLLEGREGAAAYAIALKGRHECRKEADSRLEVDAASHILTMCELYDALTDADGARDAQRLPYAHDNVSYAICAIGNFFDITGNLSYTRAVLRDDPRNILIMVDRTSEEIGWLCERAAALSSPILGRIADLAPRHAALYERRADASGLEEYLVRQYERIDEIHAIALDGTHRFPQDLPSGARDAIERFRHDPAPHLSVLRKSLKSLHQVARWDIAVYDRGVVDALDPLFARMPDIRDPATCAHAPPETCMPSGYFREFFPQLWASWKRAEGIRSPGKEDIVSAVGRTLQYACR